MIYASVFMAIPRGYSRNCWAVARHHTLPLSWEKTVSSQRKLLLPQQLLPPLAFSLTSAMFREGIQALATAERSKRGCTNSRLHLDALQFCATLVPREGSGVHTVYCLQFLLMQNIPCSLRKRHSSATSACICTGISVVKAIFLNSHHQEMPRRKTTKSNLYGMLND